MKKEIKIDYLTDDWTNNQLRYKIPHLNRNFHGLARWWHPNGQLYVEALYIHNLMSGLKKWWSSNGQLQTEAPYKKSLQCGARIDFEY